MEDIRQSFAKCKQEGRAALVGYVTAGFPEINDTVDVLLGMEEGGTDVIELGLPFTDPISDGPTIRNASSRALKNGVTVKVVLDMVKQARKRGLRVPVLLMSYYNPVLSYGEEKILKDAKAAGMNGFILVDVPPEEAVKFRGLCINQGLSYVPLIAPATPDSRMELLCKIADSFIYVVSRMGTTGATGKLSEGIHELLGRVHKYSGNIPAALGFGISTREHFLTVEGMAEGAVIGSQMVNVLRDAPAGQAAQKIKEYCSSITQRTFDRKSLAELPINAASNAGDLTQEDHTELFNAANNTTLLSSRFGEFGGQYVAESLMDCLSELETTFHEAINDPEFWKEFRSYYPYMGRPSKLHLAERLTEHAGGADIYIKREDLNHTGSHKINNAIGQILLARRLGKKRIIAETGAGQHGVATATVCAKFGMECVIYMGAEDARRQALNVFRIKLLGATVIQVETGSRTLRDAVNESLTAWVVDLKTTHYLIGSAIGPHPFPTIVRTFQSVIGQETKEQMQELTGRLPDAVAACVGGGSNAVGMFYPFANDPSVKLLGFEAGGEGIESGHHSATLSNGTKGVVHGVRTYVLQNDDGQIDETHSISAGLDYPGVGPELSSWKDSLRAQYAAVTDEEALIGFRLLSQLEGIIPALESSHAVYGVIEQAKKMKKGETIVLNLSGRGDKDVQSVAEALPTIGPKIGWDLRF